MAESTMSVSRELPKIADDLDAAITAAAGERQGWCLVVFTEGRASYISNAPRPEVVTAIKGMLASWEAGLPDIPAHKIA